MIRGEKPLSIALALLLVVSSVALATPAAALGGVQTEDEAFTDAVRSQKTLGFWSPGDDVKRYGADGHPGWVVEYSNGSADDLRRWANASTDRAIRQHLNDSSTMVVSAPASHVGATWSLGSGTPLRELSFIETPIGITRTVEVDPISNSELEDADAWDRPRGYWGATAGGFNGKLEADGAAWDEEVNASTLSDVRTTIGADQVTQNGSGIRVAVLDTGLDYKQSLYGDRVVDGKNIITGEELDETLNATERDYSKIADGNGHGSHVASTIAANGNSETGTGIAPGADLIPVKVLGDDGKGTTADIAAGLDYACREANADVVSMSLGSALPSAQIEHEIERCLEQFDVSAVIVAAGNNRMTYRYVASPADSSSTIAVAATDAKAVNESESAYFSAVGPDPETDVNPTIAAPGMKITAEVATGNRTLSGTSMAAPVVTGTVALVLEADATLVGEPDGVRKRLEETGDRLPEAGETEVGAGRVNASNAVTDTIDARTQAETSSEDAAARDTANEAIAGSLWRSLSPGIKLSLSLVPSVATSTGAIETAGAAAGG